ncbi:GGDEF domain-containing protein [Hwanghaeella grinnelliae]|uniref:diguanylate cyclase n=1 Tax=Hwanghaeella grinnelliae TaxID=2500179 RepID=A0A3S3UQR4_9PROT|nr:GGDEF domain-containing protein [Hwanghaeella grinnelliae]RVU38359.1 GGDEF domain-containing protein [Hwanghaeella grinnelliae]
MGTIQDLQRQATDAIAPQSGALDQRLLCYVLSAGTVLCALIVCLALVSGFFLIPTLIALAAMTHLGGLFIYYRSHLGSRWPLWSFLIVNSGLLLLDFHLSGWRNSIALPAMIVMTGFLPLISSPKQLPFTLASAFAMFAAMSVMVGLTEFEAQRQAQIRIFEHLLLALGLTAITAVTKATYDKARRQAETLATTDPLTGILNRRAFLEAAEAVHRNAFRAGTEYCIISLDIDHFKQINDTFGHAAGDTVLIALCDLVQNLKRAVDVWGRVGGEEFALAVPATGKEGGLHFAEKIRTEICRTIKMHEGSDTAVTVSIGVATGGHVEEPIDAVIERADQALYSAKNGGRNKVVFQPLRTDPAHGEVRVAAAQ